MLGTFVLAYTTPTKTLKSRISPARMPVVIFSRRRRPCCLLPAGFPFVVPFFVPVGRRAALPPARGDDVPPDREAVVPPRPPAGGLAGPAHPRPPAPGRGGGARPRPGAAGGGRPGPAHPRPPPPVLGVRTGAGRRTDPARGATGEVSSWDGTRNPSLTGRCDESVSATGTCACRSVASSAVHAREDRGAAAHGRCSRDGRVRGDRRANPAELLRCRPAPAPAGLTTRRRLGAENVRGVQVIPAAATAHLDGVHGELLLDGVHPSELGLGLGLAGRGTEVVAVHIVHQREAFLAADRAGDVGRLPVVLGRPGQVRTGVADLEQPGAPRVHVGEESSPLQRVIHDGSTSRHGRQCTHRGRSPGGSATATPVGAVARRGCRSGAMALPMYRSDTSARKERGRRNARVRHPRPAPPVPDARL